MLWALYATLASALAGLLIFLYYLKAGHFDDCEDVKYQMFRDDPDEEV